MTTSSSALFFVSRKTAGPFAGPVWRLGTIAELVEGGSSGPYWLVREIGQIEPAYLPLGDFDAARIVSSIALLLAATTGETNLEGLLFETHNLLLEKEAKSFAPYWDLSEADEQRIFDAFRNRVRLGATLLEEMSLISEKVVERLLELGFQVDVFRPTTDRDDPDARL